MLADRGFPVVIREVWVAIWHKMVQRKAFDAGIARDLSNVNGARMAAQNVFAQSVVAIRHARAQGRDTFRKHRLMHQKISVLRK